MGDSSHVTVEVSRPPLTLPPLVDVLAAELPEPPHGVAGVAILHQPYGDAVNHQRKACVAGFVDVLSDLDSPNAFGHRLVVCVACVAFACHLPEKCYWVGNSDFRFAHSFFASSFKLFISMLRTLMMLKFML